MATIKQNELQSYYYARLDPGTLLKNVPDTLKRLLTWVAWREEPGDNPEAKFKKIPVNPKNGKNARSNQPKTGTSYAEAVAYFSRFESLRGIGFILSEDDEACGIDCDKCVDPDTGQIDAPTMALVRFLDSYTEYTPSGEGIRILVLARLAAGAGSRLTYEGRTHEIYDRLRFLTVTGQRVPNTPAAIWGRQEIIDTLIPASARAAKPAAPPNRARDPLAPAVDAIEDKEIIAKIEASKQAEKFQGLMAGSTNGYSGYFAASGALCLILASWTRCNPERIDRIARGSGLIMDWESWWDEPYGDGRTRAQRTIDAACAIAAIGWRYAPPGDYVVSSNGNVKALLANAMKMLRSAPEWQSVLGYNEFSINVVALKSPPWRKEAGTNWSSVDDIYAADWLQRNGVEVTPNIAADAVQAVACENAFNPVRDWLKEQKWDEEQRLETWLSKYLGVADTPYARAVAKCWPISGVARIMQPGCQADYTLILEGDQGILKSKTLRTLAVRDEWFIDRLSDLKNKDALQELHGKWIVELAELASVRGSESEKVKAFLTARIDHFRPPYGRRAADFPRTNIFAGSVNDAAYLADETGNRRYWPVRCGKLDIAGLEANRAQLWAEAYALYERKEKWWFDDAELDKLAAAEQEARYVPGKWDNEIEAWLAKPVQRWEYDPVGKQSMPVLPFNSMSDFVTIADILIHAIGKTLDDFTQSDRNDVARSLAHFKWKPFRQPDGKRLRGYKPE